MTDPRLCRGREAAELFDRAEKLAPGNPCILLSRAVGTLLRRIVSLYPNTFWATNELTLALLAKGGDCRGRTHARNAVRIAEARNSTRRRRRADPGYFRPCMAGRR